MSAHEYCDNCELRLIECTCPGKPGSEHHERACLCRVTPCPCHCHSGVSGEPSAPDWKAMYERQCAGTLSRLQEIQYLRTEIKQLKQLIGEPSAAPTPESDAIFRAIGVLWDALPKNRDDDIAVAPKMALKVLKDSAMRLPRSTPEPAATKEGE